MLDVADDHIDEVRRLGWAPAGFDVGYFESEWSHYSTILNEVLLGSKAEFRAFAPRLNGHLLLPELSDAHALIAEHKRLLALGRDVERGPPDFEAIAVHVREYG